MIRRISTFMYLLTGLMLTLVKTAMTVFFMYEIRQKQEASRSFLLSQRGRMAVDLAQALDTNNTNQTRFVMDQVHRLNQEYANYADSRELLEILSGRSGTVRGQSSELAREAGEDTVEE